MRHSFIAWLLLLLPAISLAQPYPVKPISVIVPFAAGGPVDGDTRKYATHITELLGQPVVIDYKPGAGTSVGAGFVAKARPDGYTLLSDSSSYAVFPAFFRKIDFDPIKDLIPITTMHESISVLVMPASSPIRSLAEYLAFARDNPGRINYGTTGVGDISYLTGIWLHSMHGSKVTFVPYKGNGPLMIDLVAGRVDISSVSLVNALPQIQQGRLRPIAVRSLKRVKPLPDVPAVLEHPGMEKYAGNNWLGFFAPANTPQPVIDKLSTTFIAITRLPAVQAALDAQGSLPVGNTPAQFREFLADEIGRWKKLAVDNNIKAVD